MSLCKIQAPRMCYMNDVVSARNACGSLCLRNRSFLHLFCGAAGADGGLTCSIACSGRTRTFSSPQPAFCQNPFNAAATRRWREARLRAALGFSATRAERGGRYPGLICARGRGASSRVVVHPIHSLLRFCSSPCAVRRATRPTVNQDSF